MDKDIFAFDSDTDTAGLDHINQGFGFKIAKGRDCQTGY
jgi:hypothetical protein